MKRTCVAGHAPREGFALLTTLWVTLIAIASAATAATIGQRALRAARNEIDYANALWLARGCSELLRSDIDRLLADTPHAPNRGAASWRDLDLAVQQGATSAPAGCSVVLRPSGVGIDVNSAPASVLRRALLVGGVPPTLVDSAIAAIGDWADDDTVPRVLGAESTWYARNHRVSPTNQPFATATELRRVRGLENVAALETLFTTEPGRICLGHAPAAVLRTLPGMTGEAVAVVIHMRGRHEPIDDLEQLAGRLSRDGRDTLNAWLGELRPLVTGVPDAWTLTVLASAPTSRVRARIDTRFVLAGHRAAVIGRREWWS